MVQHATATTKSAAKYEDINEFQLVHALITQSLKGLSESGKSSSLDENENQFIPESTPNPSLLATICQTFNTLNNVNKHRLISRSVRDIINQLRSTSSYCATARMNKPTEKPHRKEKIVFHNHNQSCISTKSSDEVKKPVHQAIECKNEIKQISSNVHKKVLHFEKCANSGQIEESLCSKCKKSKPPSLTPTHNHPAPSTSCAEACPGGTYYRPRVSDSPKTLPPSTAENHSEPMAEIEPDAAPKILTGRNLKRVPSERFQKMRRKVQRLMLPAGSDDSSSDEERSPRLPADQTTFLQSIRIPNPAQPRQDSESRQGLMHRLPDHVLCNIFSHLDTRTLAALKCTCTDFNFVIVNFDIRSTDSCWTKNDRYIDDPCKQCRHQYTRGDQSMCRFHPKRYYSDLPYGRSYWMCCLQLQKNAPGCQTGLHDNRWHSSND